MAGQQPVKEQPGPRTLGVHRRIDRGWAASEGTHERLDRFRTDAAAPAFTGHRRKDQAAASSARPVTCRPRLTGRLSLASRREQREA